MSATDRTTPATVITTEQILGGLHPHVTLNGETIPGADEPLDKLKALLLLLQASADEETNKFRIDSDKIMCTLLLSCDLIKEAEDRIYRHQDHLLDVWAEFKTRLDACHLILCDPAKWSPRATGQEV